MNISEKHDVAMNFLAALQDGRLSLSQAATRRGVSLSYMEQLAVPLRKGGLIRSTRGPGGGYELSRPLSDIGLVDLLTCVGMNEKGDKSDLFKTILTSLNGVTVAQALTMANA